MNITENLIIAVEVSKHEPDKPYCLWIEGYGRVGDKLNVDTDSNHSTWPCSSSDRFATIEEAITAYWRFLRYVESKVEINKKKKPKPGGPSWHRWS